MNIDPSVTNSATLLLLAFGSAFLAALWLALVLWTWRDINSRARDIFSKILAVLVVAVLNLPGILVYLILRPAHTIEEEYQRTLEEEALLASIEDQQLCPGCERRVHGDWILCPGCHTKLKKTCLHCGKLMELPWNICPFCGGPTPGMKIATEPGHHATAEITPTNPSTDPLPIQPAESLNTGQEEFTPMELEDGFVPFHEKPEDDL